MQKTILTICKKELKDTVRDRRTLMAMILMPMLLMPVMTVGMFKFLDKIMEEQKQQSVKIILAGEENSPQIAEMIKAQEKMEIIAIKDLEEKYKESGEMNSISDIKKEAVIDEKVDAAVIIPEKFAEKIKNQEAVELELIRKSTNSKSENVIFMVSAILEKYNSQILQERFSDQNINPAVLSKVSLAPIDLATEKETGGFVLGLLVPLFIVMWSIVGGQYTAIDVSAGEKERKTLESLLLTPAKRVEIVLGKFLAVSAVAFVSVVIAIGSFYAALVYGGGFGPMNAAGDAGAGELAVNFSLDPQALAILLAVSIFLILMFSAIILSISIFAKSFKEAQNYIGPSYLVVILPIVMVNSVPGFEPALIYFAIPAVNAVLLFKEVLMGAYDWGHILLSLGSLAAYSAVAIFIATKIYSKESVLFRD